MRSRVVHVVAMAGCAMLLGGPARTAPTAERLALLRHDVGHRVVRLRLEGEAYEIAGARVDSSGVAFDPARVDGVARWRSGDKRTPGPLDSPIGWDRIHSIERRNSGIGRGAAIGMLVAPLLLSLSHRKHYSDDMFGVVVVASCPAGAIVGGLLGAFGATWTPVWHRPNAAGEEDP